MESNEKSKAVKFSLLFLAATLMLRVRDWLLQISIDHPEYKVANEMYRTELSDLAAQLLNKRKEECEANGV